ncbi:N-lysine methyltransferase SETD6 isoform X2 [Alligator mississippiensis]|uniref:N-lysine methyltransferase SETD6 isoform X2 n=1 Tax=Alligator mississippiensis TaxID=8496 RepID=UPI0028772BD0|nr:N-lysine methyltransferase SETD6 isoform X2 [Alligator mississippiensis]
MADGSVLASQGGAGTISTKLRGTRAASCPGRACRVAAENSPAEDCSTDAISGFLGWCKKVGLELSPKVCVSREGTVADYGMLAREDLQVGEVLFTIPRAALLSQHTTSIQALLEEGQASLQSQSGWVPLLLSLLHEYTARNSYWQPYLSLWPDLKSLDHPMFWPEEERVQLLQGTGILEAVDKDLANIHLEYTSLILPFMESHPDIFDPKLHTLELYQRLVAFVMAYSFQEPLDEDEDEKEPNPPMMVPMADILNHVASNNANLEHSPECLRMVMTQPVCKGQEIFNTYGQMANWQLVHMYGFAEPYPGNTNDTADIQMVTVRKAALERARTAAEQQLVSEQWDFLCQLEMVGEEGAFVIGWEEVLTEEELSMTLKKRNIRNAGRLLQLFIFLSPQKSCSFTYLQTAKSWISHGTGSKIYSLVPLMKGIQSRHSKIANNDCIAALFYLLPRGCKAISKKHLPASGLPICSISKGN